MHTHTSGQHQHIEAKLKSQGHRITKSRACILRILSHHTSPLTVPEVLACLDHEDMKVNKTTAYRELDFLLKQGLIYELDFGDRKKRYELSSRGHHHHLICEQCGKIEDIELEEDLQKEERHIQEATGFCITRHALEFFGLCPECQSSCSL